MGLGHYLFSFTGRINRAKQWAMILVWIAFQFALTTAFAVVVGTPNMNDEKALERLLASPQMRTFGIIVALLCLLWVFVIAAIVVKRLHDRNKSAWWIVVFGGGPILLTIPWMMAMRDLLNGATDASSPLLFISNGLSSILLLWAFVELFILRGTVGDNRYGPDPIAGKS